MKSDKYDTIYMWYLIKRYKWTYLHNRIRLIDCENKLIITKGDRWVRGKGCTGHLTYAHWGIWNDWLMGTCRIEQRSLPSILWWSMWEKNLKENGCVYMYNWITLLYSRNYLNIVKQLCFNNTLKTWKTNKTHECPVTNTYVLKRLL